MKKRPIVCLVCIYIVFLIWVLVWQPEMGARLFRWEEKETRLVDQYNGGKVEGLLLQVEERNEGGRARLRLNDGTECILILSEDDVKIMEAGAFIKVKGDIWWPEEATNPGQWNGKLYARIHDISFYMKVEDWKVIEKENNQWFYTLDQLRRGFARRIKIRWNDENASIIKAMLLGDKGELEKETTKLFRQGGISHIIAISGLHLTIISEIVSKLLKKFQKPKPVQLEVSGFLWFYVFLTGASVSALRAALMMSIRTAAVLLDREEDPINTLALTAGILLIKQPLYVMDAGFSLSFAALLGMRYGRILLMSIRWIPYRLRRILAPSMGISFVTIPLSLWFFYEASVYGFILNIWVIPAMEVLLMSILAALGLSWIHPALGQGFAVAADFLLSVFQTGSEWVAKWPGAQMRGQPELYQMMALYGIWILVLLYYSKPYRKKQRIKISLAGILLCVLAGFRSSFWRIMYLDVGQGDCAVIEWEGNVLIVDAGPEYEDVLKPYLMQRGIHEIDGVILSHSDWDHMEGLLSLSEDEDFSIKRLWLAEEKAQINDQCISLEENIKSAGGSVQKVRAGYEFQTKGFSMKVLSPMMEHQDTNEGSLVVEFDVDGWRFLFPGDIGEKTEREILEQWNDVDVLKAAHHGSGYSTSEEFLKKIQPELAIISCGRDNRYGHPHKETLQRLNERMVEYYVTADHGAIWIEEGKSQLIARKFLDE